MKIEKRLKKHGLTQTGVAKILSRGDPITPNVRIRAHRIWHGTKPNDEEMALLFESTGGKVSPNIWFGLPDVLPESNGANT